VILKREKFIRMQNKDATNAIVTKNISTVKAKDDVEINHGMSDTAAKAILTGCSGKSIKFIHNESHPVGISSSNQCNPEDDLYIPEDDHYNPEEDQYNPEDDQYNPEDDQNNPEENQYNPEDDHDTPEDDQNNPEDDQYNPEDDQYNPDDDQFNPKGDDYGDYALLEVEEEEEVEERKPVSPSKAEDSSDDVIGIYNGYGFINDLSPEDWANCASLESLGPYHGPSGNPEENNCSFQTKDSLDEIRRANIVILLNEYIESKAKRKKTE
jgi:hypothetical protein